MNDEIYHKEIRVERSRLLTIIIGLAVIYILTFMSGFLQDTPYNFFNYIFFSFLCIGGVALMIVTLKSEVIGITKGVLLLTGIDSILLFLFYIGYELFRLDGYEDLAGSIEGLLYLTSLFFWILVIISLVLIGRIGSRDSSES